LPLGPGLVTISGGKFPLPVAEGPPVPTYLTAEESRGWGPHRAGWSVGREDTASGGSAAGGGWENLHRDSPGRPVAVGA
jgi:hypothetical protein